MEKRIIQTAQEERVWTADEHEVLETAIEAGHLLLQNGAEIFRVEETMNRICRHFGVDDASFFVLGNGIFATGGRFSRVMHIPVRGARLDKVVAVNQLSREIEQGMYTLTQVREELTRIAHLPSVSPIRQILASAFSSGAFCYLFGGQMIDCAASFVAGFFLYVFVLFSPRLSKIIANIAGGAIVTLICIFCISLDFGQNLNSMIIGSLIPLVPGMAFTNGIRDLADGDYISGSVRLLDAIIVFLSIAIGVGMVFTIYHRLGGQLA